MNDIDNNMTVRSHFKPSHKVLKNVINQGSLVLNDGAFLKATHQNKLGETKKVYVRISSPPKMN